MKQTITWQGKIAAVWGVTGVIALLGFAVYRLAPFSLQLLSEQLSWWQVIVMVLWCMFMVYTEGYQAFYKQFAPRVVARAQYLLQQTSLRRTVLAPLFCVGYFGAPKKRVATAYGLAIGIITLIVVVHFVPQPWRGIIDVGVVLGLLTGIMSTAYYSLRALQQPLRLVAKAEATNR